MKHLIFFSLFSEALLLSMVTFGQNKYTKIPKSTTPVVNEKAQHYNRPILQKNAIVSMTVKDPPIINDPIDVYAENPSLLKASLTIHFGNINPSSSPLLELDGSPSYFYHNASHIRISTVAYNSGFRSNMAYTIPLYTTSDNHWTVTFQDFVDKWVDGAHTHLDFNYRVNKPAGKFSINSMSGTINKIILVLQFASGTKTIIWNDPKTFNSQINFNFDQNFNPMN